jgi:hypothetical protein
MYPLRRANHGSPVRWLAHVVTKATTARRMQRNSNINQEVLKDLLLAAIRRPNLTPRIAPRKAIARFATSSHKGNYYLI